MLITHDEARRGEQGFLPLGCYGVGPLDVSLFGHPGFSIEPTISIEPTKLETFFLAEGSTAAKDPGKLRSCETCDAARQVFVNRLAQLQVCEWFYRIHKDETWRAHVVFAAWHVLAYRRCAGPEESGCSKIEKQRIQLFGD